MIGLFAGRAAMDDPSARGLGRLAVLCAGYALVFAVLAYPRTIPTFWSADNGFKWWQASVLADQGWKSPWATYSERDIDPEGRFQPLGWKYGRLEPEGLRFTYPPAVAAWFAPFAGTGSFRLALALQALLAGLCVFLVGVIARDLGVRQFEGMALGLFGCSPWIAYVIELNEHILALTLGLGAWVVVHWNRSADSIVRGVVAGGLIGVAGLLRNELALWGVGLGLALILTNGRRTGAGVWLGTALLLSSGTAVQLLLSPDSTPIRMAEIHEDIPESSFGVQTLLYRWAILNHWLFGAGHYNEAFEQQLFHPWFWGCAGMLAAAFLIQRLTASETVARRCVQWIGAGLGIGICGIWTVLILRGVPEASGLVLAFPLITLLFLSRAARDLYTDTRFRELWIALGVFAVLLWFGVGNSRGGRQWGPRYLMIAWPFLILLALHVQGWATMQGSRFRSIWVLPLFLAGWLAAGWAGFQASTQQDEGLVSALLELSAEDPDRVFVTPHEYLPGAAGGVGHKHWMLVPESGAGEEAGLLKKLVEERGGFVWIGRRAPVEIDLSGLNKRTIHK